MFFEADRIAAIREMICSDTVEGREKALEKILPMQQGDFEAMYEAMEGAPITIRFLDPPLHEFVPTEEKDIEALAATTGKTVAEVEAIQTQEVNAHNIAVDEALLSAGCSMDITAFIQAVAKACKDEQGMSFKTAATFTLGVAAKTTAASSTPATAEAEGSVQMYSDIACAVVADGKVIATLNDAIQPKIAITAAGECTPSFSATKRELKEGYNMAAYGQPNVEGGTVKEWYIQSAAFSEYVLGKTATEIANMETKEVNAHFISVEQALLDAGCTMQITGICAVVAQAANNAR